MIDLAWIAALLFWVYGIGIFIYLVWHWTDGNKKETRISELSYVVFLFIIGFYVIILYNLEPVSQSGANLGYTIIIICGCGITAFLLYSHALGYWGYKKYGIDNDPVITRNYEQFCHQLDEKYQKDHAKDDIIKDLSRKMLHMITLAALIGIHEASYYFRATIETWGLSPLAFRNTIYLSIAIMFSHLFLYADTLRMTKFYQLPDWARKWYSKSMDERKEKWTYVSSTPFLLALLMLIFQPVQVLFVAGVVSCVADAAASVIGKSKGKHKLGRWSAHPHKSWEGLIAGVLSAFIGVFFVFQVWPYPGMTTWLQLGVAVGCAAAFAYADLWGKVLADNVMNTLLPAFVTILLLALFL
jgi:dolichol kinase